MGKRKAEDAYKAYDKLADEEKRRFREMMTADPRPYPGYVRADADASEEQVSPRRPGHFIPLPAGPVDGK
jgi:hypothetical protein